MVERAGLETPNLEFAGSNPISKLLLIRRSFLFCLFHFTKLLFCRVLASVSEAQLRLCIRKSLKICSGSNLLFRCLSFDISFQIQFISFVKRKANHTIEQLNSNIYEKRDRSFSSKMEFNDQISYLNKSLTF